LTHWRLQLVITYLLNVVEHLWSNEAKPVGDVMRLFNLASGPFGGSSVKCVAFLDDPIERADIYPIGIGEPRR
jgi:hypothetical protein